MTGWNQIADWKTRLAEGAATVFGKDRAEEQGKVDVTRMQAKIGELALANDFLGPGPDYFDKRNKDHFANKLVNRLQDLGFNITLQRVSA